MSFIDNAPIAKGGKTSIEDKDIFNFKHYAKKVQKIIQNNADNPAPLTIGVYGKWGEGKTSFLNLIENKIDLWKKKEKQKGILIYHFNPWRYSTEDEMLFDFFDGLAKSMYANKENEGFKKIGKQLIKYSRYAKAIKISASVGISSSNKLGAAFDVSEIMKALGEDLEGEETTLNTLIKGINDKLEEAQYKVVVFIDDIDRLDKDEIYTILKLIKLNANFKNFVYIVALDEEYVAKAISKRYGDNIEDGDLFLEKIINIPIHLPKIETADFKLFFDIKFKEVIDNLDFSEREEEVNRIRKEFKVYYFKNGRDVVRVLNSFFVGAFAIGEEVNLRDLFWIEFLKVKYKEVFSKIKSHQFPEFPIASKRIVTINDMFGSSDTISNSLELLKGSASYIVNLLFPNEYNDELKQRRYDNPDYIINRQKGSRINHEEHFEKYFSYHIERKFSRTSRNEILQNIEEENELKLKNNLISIRDKESINTHRFYYFIEELMEEEKIDYKFFSKFLFKNLDLLAEEKTKDVFGLSYQLKIVEFIAGFLEKKEENRYIVELSKELSIHQLCYFTTTLELKSNVRAELDVSISNKAKKEFNDDNIPFFYNLEKEHSHFKTIMYYWKKYNESSFLDYIDKNTNSLDNIKKLIRNFSPFFIGENGGSFGDLDESNYKYMKGIIDVDMLYKKIENNESQLINNSSFSTTNKPSEEQNLEQFVFWYKKDKNIE